MKNLKSFFIAGLVAVFLFSIMGANAQAKSMKELKIKVQMECENCKAKIEKELPKAEGVSKVAADLKTKIVTISYDPAKTNKDKLVAAIEKIGYKTEFSAANSPAKHDCSKECGKKGPGASCDHKK